MATWLEHIPQFDTFLKEHNTSTQTRNTDTPAMEDSYHREDDPLLECRTDDGHHHVFYGRVS